MPLLVSYCGHRVKKRRRTSKGLRLTLRSLQPGHPGAVIVVSQAEWQRHGSEVYVRNQSNNESTDEGT